MEYINSTEKVLSTLVDEVSITYIKEVKERTAANGIIMYGRICVWALGTLGNILAFLVFSRKSMSGSLSLFLFQFLAVFDFIVVQDHIQGWLRYIGIFIFDHYDWTCRIAFWILHSSQVISVWILVTISVERLIGIALPHQAKIICTVRRGKIFLFALISLSFLVNSFHTVTLISKKSYDFFDNRWILFCDYGLFPDSFLYNYVRKIRPWIIFVSYSGVPLILILGCNGAIIWFLLRRKSLMQVNILEY